jgi:uncharacterized repeat protein (TIGR01451 family)
MRDDGTISDGNPSFPFALLPRHTIPAGAPDAAQEQGTLTASFSDVNASPALVSSVTAGDLTRVSAGAGGLETVKSVDVPGARPGDLITYTITYRNLGPLPVQSIVIHDATPACTVFDAASYEALGSGLSACAVRAFPAAGAMGAVQWTLTGARAPGGSGVVRYRVRVQ